MQVAADGIAAAKIMVQISNECVPANVVYCPNLFKRAFLAKTRTPRRLLYGDFNSGSTITPGPLVEDAVQLFNACSTDHCNNLKLVAVNAGGTFTVKPDAAIAAAVPKIAAMQDEMYASGIVTQVVADLAGGAEHLVEEYSDNMHVARYLLQPRRSSRKLFSADELTGVAPLVAPSHPLNASSILAFANSGDG
jgi:hypothetical protein